MRAAISQEGSVTVLKPVGPMIMTELEELEEQLRHLVDRWIKRLVINCSEIPFVDSAGLELLCRFQRQLKDRGLNFKLAAPTDMVQKILQVTRLGRRFEVYPDVVAAVRSYL